MKVGIYLLALLVSLAISVDDIEVKSPDQKVVVNIKVDNGKAYYLIKYDNEDILLSSRLGISSNVGDWIDNLSLINHEITKESRKYDMSHTKASHVEYEANKLVFSLANSDNREVTVTFMVFNNDVAFRYTIQSSRVCVYSEISSFRFPDNTKTFLSHKQKINPSYERVYQADKDMTDISEEKVGYVFPALFHLENDRWALISETEVTSNYVGSHLSDFSNDNGYTIAYPDKEESNGIGDTYPSMAGPGNTPWRTITFGNDLRPIIETTVTFDLVRPLYEPSIDYKPGRYTWSWLIWQLDSINYDDQVKFIDLNEKMGFEYVLIDAEWDNRIGRDRMAELSKYAQSKGVQLMLWYNSNGYLNDVSQSPKDLMHNSIARDREMKWMQSIGIAGIKVDFFAGDKQNSMQLYEDIHFDANRYGLLVIFHGSTLPRGWEILYPNFVANEAVVASEMVYFVENDANREAYDLTLHPFCRNAVASMDWGGVIMNRKMSKDNNNRHSRKTTDTFELASGIVTQAFVQCIEMQPNNLDDLPQIEIDFLKNLPSTWDETRFIDGYPGRFVILARRHEQTWYIAGLNAENDTKDLIIRLPMVKEKSNVDYYTDNNDGYSQLVSVKVDNNSQVRISMRHNGGFIIVANNE